MEAERWVPRFSRREGFAGRFRGEARSWGEARSCGGGVKFSSAWIEVTEEVARGIEAVTGGAVTDGADQSRSAWIGADRRGWEQ